MIIRHTILLCLCFLWLCGPSFAQAPILTASGDQLYCPLSTVPVTTAFNIQNPSSSPINEIYIQISEGYERAYDRLQLTGNHPGISSNWNQATGKLRLSMSEGAPLNDLINAVHDVHFQSDNSAIRGARVFSITTGQANYLASTGHYYEFVPNLGISWREARVAAEARTYYGLQGYLATLTSPEEAQLGGEQANGAGWIGGTDEASEGVWKWVTGPEGLNGGLVFWYGIGTGYSPNFAHWNTNQPDNAHGGPGEDYVHITDPSIGINGAWNDLRVEGDPPGAYHPKGYIVEYGGMPGDPEINISTSTRLYSPVFTETKTAYTCGPGKVTLRATADEGSVYWFTSATGGTPVHQGIEYNPTVNATTDFYVLAAPTGCYEGARQRITVSYYDPIGATADVTLTECAIDGSNAPVTFNLEEAIPLLSTDSSYKFKFYSSQADAEAGVNELTDLTISNETANLIFVRISNGTPCFEFARVNLNVSSTSLPNDFRYSLSSCDNDGTLDGKQVFNLGEARTNILNILPGDQNYTLTFYPTVHDAATKANSISDEANFINEIPGRQEIFVRIENEMTNACYSMGPYVELIVDEIPQFILSDSGQICNLQPSYEVEVLEAAGSYSYEWYDEAGNHISSAPNLTVTRPGTYSVYATSSQGCTSETKNVEIIDSGPPNVTINNVKITATGDTYRIDVLDLDLLGSGDYEFALNDPTGQYQDGESFHNVLPGAHTLYTNDKNGCGTNSLVLFLFGIPEYFTPNNDGHNDYWNIKGLSNPQSSVIFIFDRYGKLLSKLDPRSKGWDGTYNGKNMPADDYWYQVQLEDGTIHKGHFSLIRSVQ